MKKNSSPPSLNNINDLRADVIKIYQELRTNQIGLREAKVLFHGAGKIMNTAKLQLEYNTYIKSGTHIPFLEVPEENQSATN